MPSIGDERASKSSTSPSRRRHASVPGFRVSPHSLSRGNRARSSSSTRAPPRASTVAATLPAGPAPQTMTSNIILRGASPRRTPLHVRSRGPRAPLRSRGSLAAAHSRNWSSRGGLRPAAPPYTCARGGPGPRSAHVARSPPLTRADAVIRPAEHDRAVLRPEPETVAQRGIRLRPRGPTFGMKSRSQAGSGSRLVDRRRQESVATARARWRRCRPRRWPPADGRSSTWSTSPARGRRVCRTPHARIGIRPRRSAPWRCRESSRIRSLRAAGPIARWPARIARTICSPSGSICTR